MNPPTQPLDPQVTPYLTCTAGPDAGKRLVVTEQGITFGRAHDNSVLSDDPHVGRRHLMLQFAQGQMAFACQDHAVVYVGGHEMQQGVIHPGQPVRIGGSDWQMGNQNAGFFDAIGGRISDLVGLERVQGFSIKSLFSEVFKRRADEDVEEYFMVGARSTTPGVLEIDANWPKPWVFVKMLALSALVYLGFVGALQMFGNPNLVPGTIMVGAFVIPFTILIFFFEVNVPKNVSLYQVLKLVMLGGMISLFVALIGFSTFNLRWLGASSAGIIEEIAKLATLFIFVNKTRYRWTLNGLLFGVAVGTGFSAFESAGYAFTDLTREGGGLGLMLESIKFRGLLCLLGDHTLWAGLVGAALWKVKGERKFEFSMLADHGFLRIMAFVIALHMLWNAPFQLPFMLKQWILGFAAWAALLSFIQDGLKQVKREQARLLTSATIPVLDAPPSPAVLRQAPATTVQTYTIGRADDCDVVIDHTSVSRRHAALTLTPQGRLLLADLQSQNGTHLLRSGQAQSVRETHVEASDTVQFGDVQVPVADLLRQVESKTSVRQPV